MLGGYTIGLVTAHAPGQHMWANKMAKWQQRASIHAEFDPMKPANFHIDLTTCPQIYI